MSLDVFYNPIDQKIVPDPSGSFKFQNTVEESKL